MGRRIALSILILLGLATAAIGQKTPDAVTAQLVCDGKTDSTAALQAAVNQAIASTGVLSVPTPMSGQPCKFTGLVTAVPSDANHTNLSILIGQNVVIQYNAYTGWIKFDGAQTVAGCFNSFLGDRNCRWNGVAITGLSGIPGTPAVKFTLYADQRLPTAVRPQPQHTDAYLFTFDHVNNFSLSNILMTPPGPGINDPLSSGIEVIGSYNGLIQNNNLFWLYTAIDLKSTSSNPNDVTSFVRIKGNEFQNVLGNAIQTSGSVPTNNTIIDQNYFENNNWDGTNAYPNAIIYLPYGLDAYTQILNNFNDASHGKYGYYLGGNSTIVMGGQMNEGPRGISNAFIKAVGSQLNMSGFNFASGGAVINLSEGTIVFADEKETGTETQGWITGVSFVGSFASYIVDNSALQNNNWRYRTTSGTIYTHSAKSQVITGAMPTNDNASIGNVGEYIGQVVVSKSAVFLTNSKAANVPTVELSSGDWDATCDLYFNVASTTKLILIEGSISLIANTMSTAAGTFQNVALFSKTGASIGVTPSLHIGPTRLSINGATGVACVARATFGVSTVEAWGLLGARRVR